jgi:hypothetical protein
MAAAQESNFMIPTKIIVTAIGEFKPGLAVILKFGMSQKNDYHYIVFLGDDGKAQVGADELLREFDQTRNFFLMDFKNPREFFNGHIEARFLKKEEIEKAITGMFKYYDYPQNYLENLKRAITVNHESKCTVAVEKITT